MRKISSPYRRHVCTACHRFSGYTYRNNGHLFTGCSHKFSCDYRRSTASDFQAYELWPRIEAAIVDALNSGKVVINRELTTLFDKHFRWLVWKTGQRMKYYGEFRPVARLLAAGFSHFENDAKKRLCKLDGSTHRGGVLHAPGTSIHAEPVDLRDLLLDFFIPEELVDEILSAGPDTTSEVIERAHLLHLKLLAEKYEIYQPIYEEALNGKNHT